MPKRIKGLYADNNVWINKLIKTNVEKRCILAEEIGHHETSFGDILDLNDIRKSKQELKARQWAYEKLVPLKKIVQAYHERIKGRHEIAEFLGVTEEFLQSSIDRYFEIYGVFTIVDNYIIRFDPLGVFELFE